MTFPYLIKALYSGVITFLGTLLGILQAGDGAISGESWVVIILATVLAIGGVLGLQAAPKTVATGVKE